MMGKRWAAYYILWAVSLSFLVGCETSISLDEILDNLDWWDDFIDLLDMLIDFIYQFPGVG